MTIFKTFLKIVNKNKIIILMYTLLVLVFGVINSTAQSESLDYAATKPDIAIINSNPDNKLTQNFVKYIGDHANLIEVDYDEEKINDALFYREVNYVIYLPESFGEDLLKGIEPEIKVKSSGDYQASLAEMIVTRYLQTAKIYQQVANNETELIEKLNETLAQQVEVEIASALNTDALAQATTYYNFESYGLMACLIYVICFILSTFNNENVKKRTIISSFGIGRANRILWASNCLYAVMMWLLYLGLSAILFSEVIFSVHGMLYAINSLVFTICATALAFLLGNLIQNKTAINGVVNVIALGSSFLCGAFVPMKWLPDFVLDIAHALPTYYYISNNELVKSLELINLETLRLLIINTVVMLIFAIGFIVITNLILHKKSRIG